MDVELKAKYETRLNTISSVTCVVQSVYKSIKVSVFFCLMERYCNIYYSATMNFYLHICEKLSLHLIEFLSRPITW